MKRSGWVLGCGATLVLIVGLLALFFLIGARPFSPGALSAEHPQGLTRAGFVSHADFEARCDLCHAPFRGTASSLCLNCHTDVRDQITTAQSIHGRLSDPQQCDTCHTDHKGRAASLTRISFANFPHDQFHFSLTRHTRDYSNQVMTCRGCHNFADPNESSHVLAMCIDCHTRHDAKVIAEHRRAMGNACLACHDGTSIKNFDHAKVFALDGKHKPVACAKCHSDNQFHATPRACAQCHAEPAIHRGQYGVKCDACHTAIAWRPANLIRHTFPFDHGGKPMKCEVCHPTNYATYSCFTCHAHEQTKITRTHLDANIRELEPCTKCHATGKKIE